MMSEEPDEKPVVQRNFRISSEAIAGPAPYANLISAYVQDGVIRISFLEENPERSQITFRSGVLMSVANARQLKDLLQNIISDLDQKQEQTDGEQ